MSSTNQISRWVVYDCVYSRSYSFLRAYELGSILHFVFNNIEEKDIRVSTSNRKLVLLCLKPSAACDNILSICIKILLDRSRIVCCLVKFRAVPQVDGVVGIHWQEHVLEGVILDWPDCLLLRVGPGTDAVVLSIEGVTVLVHFRDRRSVPHLDISFDSSCEK